MAQHMVVKTKTNNVYFVQINKIKISFFTDKMYVLQNFVGIISITKISFAYLSSTNINLHLIEAGFHLSRRATLINNHMLVPT